MEQVKANNYEAAKTLDWFEKEYIVPLKEKVQAGKKALNDKTRKWKEGEKERTENLIDQFRERLVNYKALHQSVFKMIMQHEEMASKLSQMYNIWYTKIAYKGKQPTEMLSVQAEMLQEIFTDIYGFIEDIVKDELKAPSND